VLWVGEGWGFRRRGRWSPLHQESRPRGGAQSRGRRRCRPRAGQHTAPSARRKTRQTKSCSRCTWSGKRGRKYKCQQSMNADRYDRILHHFIGYGNALMLKRAVVTGMGVVSPNGIGKTAFCRAIMDGSSGVKLITRFDTSELPIKIAGEIQNFNELDWMEARERKHVSRCVPLAIAAATEALTDSDIDPAKLSLDEQREIGVVLGSGGGAQEFSELQYHLYYTGKVKQVSLFTIPSGTMGTMSS